MTDKHQADLDRVSTQNSITDFTRGVEERPKGGLFTTIIRSAVESTPFGQAVRHGTDFDGLDLDLNEMLDLVEKTNPEDLESSGIALWDARDAIKAAAEELSGHIDSVHWVGKSGDAFREWGASLVTDTRSLSDFAGGAGDQITAAAVGLASVRGALPPRDKRANPKRAAAFTETEKVASKDEYAAAVQVEKHRQETINQMNRLSSYYSVSKERLQVLQKQAPTFTDMPDVGVPKPTGSGYYTPVGHSSNGVERTETTVGGAHHPTAVSTIHTSVRDTSDTPAHRKDVTATPATPDIPVRTNVDSVGTLPPTSTAPVTSHTPPVTGAPAAGGGLTSGFEGGFGTAVPNSIAARGMGGAGGLRTPASAQGRAATSGLSNGGSGRSAGRGPTSQMGRTTETGRSLAKGPASGAKPSPMGRGVTGGTPRAGGTAAPRSNGGSSTGAGRANGVVGGRPTATGETAGKSGSRIPRGTVVGAEDASNSRPASGRPGQRGVIGAPEPTARPGSGTNANRAGMGSSGAVTGQPAARNSVARAERNGMTRGGSGLVRSAGNHEKAGDRDNAEGAACPDRVVEDEETHMPTKPRRDTPPAVN